jgi:regulator of PEP synthase PpsR (kinase-PPPase family)
MSVIAVSGGILAIKKLIENITTDLYARFKDGYSDKLKRIEALKNTDSLYTKIDEVGKVKTIWQTDKAVSLKSFYCHTFLTYDNVRITVKTLPDITIGGNLLIEGIAGQGKSIFMRYLCINELEAGNVIPVFMELRRLTEGDKLIDFIHWKLRELGFDIDDNILKYLCSINRIVFLMDGFDEVPDKMHIPLINELEEITSSFCGIRIIISSRPESGLEFLSSISVIKIDHVRNEEYKDFVNKLSDDSLAAKQLIEQVDRHKSDIKQLLCTPLMITLLVLTYKSFQKVPEQLSDFFETMFHLMLQRHDGTKPGFRRERKCTLNDVEYQRIFEALCFLLKDKGQSYKLTALYGVAEKAINLTRITADPQHFISDINKITCLLLYEGKEYRFLHKSIQEYFAASFIKYKPEKIASIFYNGLIDDGSNRDQEILFLEDIDRYRFYKYYFLPLSNKILHIHNKVIPRKIKLKYLETILENTLVYNFDGDKRFYYSNIGGLRGLLNTALIRNDARSLMVKLFYTSDILNKSADAIIKVMSDTAYKPNIKVATLQDIYTANICKTVITEFAEQLYDVVHTKALEVQTYLKEEEKADFLIELDNIVPQI